MDNNQTQPTVTQSMPPQQPVMQTSTSSKGKLKPLLLSLLAIAVLVAVGYGVYSWQHNKVNTLNSKLTGLQSQLSNTKTIDTPSSASQGTLSSPMPQSQFANPEYISTLNYLDCVKVEGQQGVSEKSTGAVCSEALAGVSNGSSFPAPTTFTYALISNYSMLPESADSTFVNATKQQFQSCKSENELGGPNVVDYSSANFVIFSNNVCNQQTSLYQNKNGSWKSVAGAVGAGGTPPSCSQFSADNIPENILKNFVICQ